MNAWRSSGTLLASAPPERCTESIFTEHQRQVCDYALVYAKKKNDGEAPNSVSFTATQSGDVIVQLHPHSQRARCPP